MLVDASSLTYRAFFAVPESITDAEGRPVNAGRGFVDIVARLLVDRRPRETVVVFDADWRPAWRVAIYEGYKGARAEDPPALPRQFDVIAELLDIAGIARAEGQGFEADDVIATLVARKQPGAACAIVSGDRDLTALVRDPDVALLYAARGVGRLEDLDEEAVRAKYGVAPPAYIDFAMLRGDPSDNLSGVAGIGPVRAAKLLATYGSVEGILEHVDQLPVNQAKAFERARDYLSAMRRIVPLRRDVDVSATAPHPPEAERLSAFAEANNVRGPVTRLLRALEQLPRGA
jgi:5'-3' exonuclease